MKPAVSKILAFTLLLLSAASCKKSGSDAPAAKSKTVLLTQVSWKIQSVALDADKNNVADPNGDLTSSLRACQMDNVYSFKSDNTGVMDEGASKCDINDPQTKAFTWLFKNNETTLSGTYGLGNNDASIVSMDDTTLVITYDDNFGTPTSYHLLATFKH